MISCASPPGPRPSAVYCDRRLESLELRISDGSVALAPWLSSDRSLASGPAQGQEMAPSDRESWAAWAEARLGELQEQMDLLPLRNGGREIRKELSDAANSMVTFAGYAQKGRTERMNKALEAARMHAWRARELACNIERS